MMRMRLCSWAAAAAALVAGSALAAEPLTTERDKLSYAVGADMGGTMRRSRMAAEIDVGKLLDGFRDAFAGGELALPEEQLRDILKNFGSALQAKTAAQAKEAAAKNLAAGEKFLAENAAKPGVKKTKSGLQYKVLKEGKGEKPKAADTVITQYKGTLVDGTEFDSSFKRGQPAAFPVKGVIPGWSEALQLMPVGSKWQLVVPAALAYGENGPPPIGPNQTLVFEVELIAIQREKKQ